MRLTLAASALALTLPFLGSSTANATNFGIYVDDDGPRYRTYRHYRDRHYDGPRYRSYRHYRYGGRPESYRTGSRRWWQEMDREDRGGRSPRG